MFANISNGLKNWNDTSPTFNHVSITHNFLPTVAYVNIYQMYEAKELLIWPLYRNTGKSFIFRNRHKRFMFDIYHKIAAINQIHPLTVSVSSGVWSPTVKIACVCVCVCVCVSMTVLLHFLSVSSTPLGVSAGILLSLPQHQLTASLRFNTKVWRDEPR